MYEAHPLIHYQYNDKEDMFDAHSYDKGALVLHLLRMHLGDEAFFAGIQHYIQANALTDVEYDELRIAQEEVSGRDLQGFFNQWFNSTGHPDWSVKLTHANDSIHIDIHQNQYMDKGYNLFECPLEIAVYNSSSKKHEYTFDISSEKEHFAIARPDSNSTIHVDPEKKILGRISIEYSQEDYRQIYQNAKHPIARFEAIKSLLPLINSDSTLCSAILSDPYFRIRAFGVRALENPDSSILNQLKELSFEDPHPLVRHESINLLGNYSDDEWLHLLSDNMLKEPSQRVLLASFAVLLENEPTYAIAPAMNYVLQKSFGLQEASFQALRKNKNVRFFPIMEKALMQKHGKELDRLLKEYVLMAGEIGEEGRIHARNHINNLLKTKNKNDLDYTILIKYRQSLL